MPVTIGILQAGYGVNVSENVSKTINLIEKNYSKADLIILPEYSMVNILAGLKPDDVYNAAEPLEESNYLSRLEDLASELNVHILAHFIEKTGNPPLARSTSVLIKPFGGWEPVYSKMHLFDAYGYSESKYFIPGEKPSKEILLKGMRFAVAICYDLRFPELFRHYARRGIETILVHSGWVRGPLKEETLEFLSRARAHENTVWIVVADHYGENYVGRSMVIDPYGVKQLDLGIGEKYVEYTIDKELVYEARKTIPALMKSIEKWEISYKS
ncbi:carbon-nitrogen hydrolase family protein [Desulfurococcaceae archaeon MEX13E-LK6-19]|nr:carbon-nitrogen hydrolase family protein [Desulfurococcaceae archaeon MEX13E-LK6-19]